MGLLSTIGAASGRAFGFTRSAIAQAVDAYFNLTTLLLPGNGTNGAQNNTFLDSSTNNFTITRNGNTTQGTFSPFSQTGWSNYFDGSNSFLQRASPSSALFDWTSTNWTLEFWIYANAFGQGSNTGSNVIGNASDSTNNEYWSFGPISTGAVRWYYYTGASPSVTTTTTLATGRWYHLAFVNNGGNLTIYIDGVSSATAAITGTPQFGSGFPINVGKVAGSSFNGYLSNLRITQSAVYTSNFTPSTTPLTAISGTQLLMCQSNRFRDVSANAFVFTPSGSPSVQAFSPFLPTAAYSAATVGGSGYFDGSGDYLSVPASSQFLPGANTDFTFEAWVYLTAAPSAQGATVVGTGEYGLNSDWSISINSSRQPSFFFNVLPTGFSITSSTAVDLNSWNHIAVTRSGTGTNNLKLFLNGVNVAQASRNDTMDYSGNNLSIGADENGDESVLTGYISGLRLINGTGYTSISVPTAPPTAITNTVLLLNYTNAGITDAAAKNVLETAGNAQISTTQSKFGGSSMYFDGTGDSLDINNTQLGIFSSGDFTIECWIYFNALPGSGSSSQIIDFRGFGVGTNVAPCLSLYNASGTYNIRFESGSSVIADRSVSVSTGTWYHLAAVRSSGNVSIYWNGTISGTAFSLTTNYSTGYPVRIGAYTSSVSVLNGYIDDLRVTRFARYTGSTITVPTAAFALQ